MLKKITFMIRLFKFSLLLKWKGFLFRLKTGNLFTHFETSPQGVNLMNYCLKVIENPSYTYTDYAEQINMKSVNEIADMLNVSRKEAAFNIVTLMLGLC